MEVSRLIEDLTISHQGGWYSVISLHGGGSPEAMKREIWRNYPLMEKVCLRAAGRARPSFLPIFRQINPLPLRSRGSSD
jgi:aromatic ring hydroxylase